MNQKTYYQIVSLIFAALALAHLARLYYGWEAAIGGVDIPLEASWVAFGIAGYLAVRGWQFAQARGKR